MHPLNLVIAIGLCWVASSSPAAAGDAPVTAPQPAVAQPAAAQPAGAGGSVSTGTFFRVGAGGDYRSIHGLPLYSGAFEISVGGQGQEIGAFGTVGFALGRTPKGLSAWELMWSGSLISRFNPFYAGGTLRSALVNIERFTSTDSMQALTLGLQGFAGYELFAREEVALFAEVRAGYDMADQDKVGEGRDRVFFPRLALRAGARF